MYCVTIKGRNLAELKKAVSDINDELHQGKLKGNVQKKMEGLAEEVVAETKLVREPFTQTSGRAECEAPVNSASEVIENTLTRPAVKEVALNTELDTEGIPWDARIHTKAKTKVAAGTWKLIRGVDKALVVQVKAEHASNALNPPVVVQAPATPVQAAPVVQAPATPVPTMPTGGHTVESFSINFPMVFSGLIGEGKITQDYVNQLKTYFNVDEIWNIDEEQKIQVYDQFVNLGLITKVE